MIALDVSNRVERDEFSGCRTRTATFVQLNSF
jgi:hypothetical protein